MLNLFAALTVLAQPIRARLQREDGLEAIEYALIAALLSAILVGVIATLGTDITEIFTAIGARLDDAGSTITPASP